MPHHQTRPSAGRRPVPGCPTPSHKAAEVSGRIAEAIAAFVFPRKKMNPDEILMIAAVASATFAILDMYAPTIGVTARQGAGFGIGASLVDFPGRRM